MNVFFCDWKRLGFLHAVLRQTLRWIHKWESQPGPDQFIRMKKGVQPYTGTFLRPTVSGSWEWSTWRENELHGQVLYRRADGTRQALVEWVDDNRSGNLQEWYMDGTLRTQAMIDNTTLLAYELFHPDGRIAARYANGVEDFISDLEPFDSYVADWTDDTVWYVASEFSDASAHQVGLIDRLPGPFQRIGKDVTQLIVSFLLVPGTGARIQAKRAERRQLVGADQLYL